MTTPVNPPMQNVTPVAPAQRPPNRRNQILAIVVLVLLVYAATRLFGHHENKYEKLADEVTTAIANNDMTPVIGDFNAIRRPELEDRGRVGRLSDMVVALGKFEGSTEITPANAPSGGHEFTEKFANGTLDEKYVLDADGKIVTFHIQPPSTTTTQ